MRKETLVAMTDTMAHGSVASRPFEHLELSTLNLAPNQVNSRVGSQYSQMDPESGRLESKYNFPPMM